MALRPLLDISQGRGATSDDRANKETKRQSQSQTHNIFLVLFLFIFYLACISAFWILFETLDCILKTSFTFSLLF